ncbi:MAG: molybdopterin synthase catalytic subunit, partial [Mesorhizobium sp.]
MTGAVVPIVRIQAQDFDVAAEIARLTQGRTDIGAVVSFSGLCRDEQGTLSALELEHYPGMAEA